MAIYSLVQQGNGWLGRVMHARRHTALAACMHLLRLGPPQSFDLAVLASLPDSTLHWLYACVAARVPSSAGLHAVPVRACAANGLFCQPSGHLKRLAL